MLRQRITSSAQWFARRKQRARAALRHALSVAALTVCAVVLMGPLTYDEHAHLRLDVGARQFAKYGNQVIGLDLTAPRQNIFSLVRDLDRSMIIVDHGIVRDSRGWGLMQFMTRGSMHTVADALRWFDVSLTKRQAIQIGVCRPLDAIREGEAIVIQSDPYQQGVASWYGPGFHGRLAASGEIYNMYDRTAAHRTLPLQTLVRVVSQRTGKSVVVRINDRGPYVGGRIIDMSRLAMDLVGGQDLAAVSLEVLDPDALNVSCP